MGALHPLCFMVINYMNHHGHTIFNSNYVYTKYLDVINSEYIYISIVIHPIILNIRSI